MPKNTAEHDATKWNEKIRIMLVNKMAVYHTTLELNSKSNKK